MKRRRKVMTSIKENTQEEEEPPLSPSFIHILLSQKKNPVLHSLFLQVTVRDERKLLNLRIR